MGDQEGFSAVEAEGEKAMGMAAAMLGHAGGQMIDGVRRHQRRLILPR